MAQTLYATFADASLAEKAVGALLDYGVRSEDISVISREHGVRDTQVDADGNTHVENTRDEGEHAEKAGKHGLSTTTGGDARSGATKGAEIGLGVGVVAAIASLIVPGFGLVMGGGALAVAIAGAAGATAAGAVAGGVTGYLKDQGVPDTAAIDYHHAYDKGAALLSVNVPSEKVTQIEIEGILAKYRAENINTYATATS